MVQPRSVNEKELLAITQWFHKKYGLPYNDAKEQIAQCDFAVIERKDITVYFIMFEEDPNDVIIMQKTEFGGLQMEHNTREG